jgi:hypothetical protein
MSTWRMVGVLLVVLSAAVPVDMFACGDKLLMAGRYTRFQRPKNWRSASVLIYADPASAMGATIKKAKIDKVLTLEGHRITKVQTLQQLSTTMSGGRFDVILTANGDSANVERLLQAPDASVVLGVDDLLKNPSLLDAIDKAVLQRDQNLKKPVKR